jgi:hypothetical protein
MTTTAQLAETLSIEVPSCPLSTIRDMIQWAQRDFCTHGNIWIVRDEPVVVAADTDYPELEIPTGGEAIRIISLTTSNGTLKPDIDFRQVGVNSIKFASKPKDPVLYGAMSCRPVIGKDMPEELISRWSEELMDGARSRLFMLPNQPWSSPELAQFYRLKFMDSKSDAIAKARDGYQFGSVRMRTRMVM